MSQEETLAALVAELGQLRATIAQQQTAIEALQHARPHSVDAEVAHAESETEAHAGAQTSRRSLLKGAAVATAAATVATVATGAMGAPQTAHAASGSALVLGQANDANATTALANTAGSAPNPVLTVTNNNTTTTTGSTALSVTNNNNNPNTTGSNDGIDATTSGGAAMYGYDSNGGIGVEGNGGAGVVGFSGNGLGVAGVTYTGIDLAALGTGRIYQSIQGQVGVPSGSFMAGESIRDANGDLWLCVASTTSTAAAQWVKMAHLAPGFSSGGATTYLSKPIRLLDTRAGATDAIFTPNTKYTSASPYSLQIAGDTDTKNNITVPNNLAGAIGNVTVVNPSGSGYLALVPHSAGFSGTANLAYSTGQVVSNSFNVGLSSGALDIIIGGASTDVIVDLFAVVA